jgi:hypothetical protein
MAPTWNKVSPGGTARTWSSANVSKTGQYVIASSTRSYISNDYGYTWTEVQPFGNQNTNLIFATNDDFSKIVCISTGSTSVRVSTDYGANWSTLLTMSYNGSQIAFATKDESVMIACSNASNSQKVYYYNFANSTLVNTVTTANGQPIGAVSLDQISGGSLLGYYFSDGTYFDLYYMSNLTEGSQFWSTNWKPTVSYFKSLSRNDSHVIVACYGGRLWGYYGTSSHPEFRPNGNSNRNWNCVSKMFSDSVRAIFCSGSNSTSNIFINTSDFSNGASTTFEALVPREGEPNTLYNFAACSGSTSVSVYPDVIVACSSISDGLFMVRPPEVTGVPLKIHNGSTWDEAVSLKVRGESGWESPVSVKAYDGAEWQDVAV